MAATVAVRQAVPSDLPEVFGILDAAAAWLRSRGIEQWPVPYPRRPTEEALAAGGLLVGERAGRIVATARTMPSDVEVWGEDPTPAVYVHGLAARRDTPGAGDELLQAIVADTGQRGRGVVRLDCWGHNERLRSYYLAAGFRHVRDIEEQVGGRVWPVSLFERDHRPVDRPVGQVSVTAIS